MARYLGAVAVVILAGLLALSVRALLLAVTYLGVWLIFGVVCYAIYTAAGMPWPNQAVVVGLALALAGVYSFTPIKRASQARCRCYPRRCQSRRRRER